MTFLLTGILVTASLKITCQGHLLTRDSDPSTINAFHLLQDKVGCVATMGWLLLVLSLTAGPAPPNGTELCRVPH